MRDVYLNFGDQWVADKFDMNNEGGANFSSDHIGANTGYADANYATRAAIIADHRIYQQGLIWVLATDPAAPQVMRDEMNSYGLDHLFNIGVVSYNDAAFNLGGFVDALRVSNQPGSQARFDIAGAYPVNGDAAVAEGVACTSVRQEPPASRVNGARRPLSPGRHPAADRRPTGLVLPMGLRDSFPRPPAARQ